MKKKKLFSAAGTGIFTILGIVYIMPILIVLMNSFKKKVFINKEPFGLPTEKTWNSIENYLTAIDKYELLSAVGWTVFITLGSVLVILICMSMCAWYITRIQTRFTKALYLLCVFYVASSSPASPPASKAVLLPAAGTAEPRSLQPMAKPGCSQVFPPPV